jgi:hypothetical protein
VQDLRQKTGDDGADSGYPAGRAVAPQSPFAAGRYIRRGPSRTNAMVWKLRVGRIMTTPSRSDEDAPTSTESMKCAHPSCSCQLLPNRPFGKYCGEHCENAGELNELRCECGHDMCR